MTDRTARLLAWAAFAACLGMWLVDAAYGLMLLTFPIAGLVICTPRPRSRIRCLMTLTGRLRDQVDLEALRVDMLRVVNDTVQPGHAALWLRPQGEGR